MNVVSIFSRIKAEVAVTHVSVLIHSCQGGYYHEKLKPQKIWLIRPCLQANLKIHRGSYFDLTPWLFMSYMTAAACKSSKQIESTQMRPKKGDSQTTDFFSINTKRTKMQVVLLFYLPILAKVKLQLCHLLVCCRPVAIYDSNSNNSWRYLRSRKFKILTILFTFFFL